MRQKSIVARPRRSGPISRVIVGSSGAIMLGGLLGAGVGAIQASRTPTVWRSDAVVMATSPTLPASQFADLSRSLFATRAVIGPVVEGLGINLSWDSVLSEGFLEEEEVAGISSLRIVGRARSPQLASGLATRAATSFVAVATSKGLGRFATFDGEAVGVKPSVTTYSAWGGETGVLLGAVIVIVVLAARRPVYGEHDIDRIVVPDMVFRASVQERPRRARRETGVRPRGLAQAIWNAAVARGEPGSPELLTAIESGSRQTQAVAAFIQQALNRGEGGRAGAVRAVSARRNLNEWTAGSVEEARAVVAVVRTKTSRRELERLREAFVPVRADAARFLVLVS